MRVWEMEHDMGRTKMPSWLEDMRAQTMPLSG